MSLPIGNADFQYPAAAPTVTVALQAPIRGIEPIDSTPVMKATGFDKTKTEIISFGTGVKEIVCTLRYINNPRNILDMLNAMAVSGTLVRYRENAVVKFTNAELVEPEAGDVKLILDRDLKRWGRYEVTIWLRRTDGGNFDSVLVAGA